MTEIAYTNEIEAILLAAGRPVSVAQIQELFDEQRRPDAQQVQDALEELGRRCEDRAVELREVASGWRLQIRTRHAETVSRLWQERPSRYSRALLETLALIAYRQPITRGEIEEIRGVSVSTTIMRTLQERNWVRVVGHREVPGRPELLGTTKDFLDTFGLKSLEDLPSLAELSDLDDLNVQLDLQAPESADNAGELPALDGATDSDEASEPAPQSLATGDREVSADEPLAIDDEDLQDDDEDAGREASRVPTLVAAPPDDGER
jgi:segregation and condensation protein B